MTDEQPLYPVSVFLITYKANGQILSCAAGDEVTMNALADAKKVSSPDQLTLFNEFKATDVNCYINSEGKVALKEEQPASEGYAFNYETAKWQFDLGKAREEAWHKIKLKREVEELGFFVWAGKQISCSEDSVRRINTAVMLAMIDNEVKINWTTLQNDEICLTASDILEVGEAMAYHVQGVFDKAKRLKNELQDAKTEAAIQEVKYDT